MSTFSLPPYLYLCLSQKSDMFQCVSRIEFSALACDLLSFTRRSIVGLTWITFRTVSRCSRNAFNYNHVTQSRLKWHNPLVYTSSSAVWPDRHDLPQNTSIHLFKTAVSIKYDYPLYKKGFWGFLCGTEVKQNVQTFISWKWNNNTNIRTNKYRINTWIYEHK